VNIIESYSTAVNSLQLAAQTGYINVSTDRTVNSAVHCWRQSISSCCVTLVEQSSTTRNFSTIYI